MKRFSHFIAGTVFGAVVFSGTTIFANTDIASTVVAPWVKYIFNDKEKELPVGYSTIIYEGHTYVPARFIAEELGANVEWDEENKIVKFENKETNKEEEKNDSQPETNSIQYESLPVTKLINGVSVEVYNIEQNNGFSKVYLRIKNTNKQPFQFDQESAQLKVDNSILTNIDVSESISNKKDKSWYKDILEDVTQEGYVMLPEFPDIETKNGILKFNVVQNDKDQKTTPFEFNIKW